MKYDSKIKILLLCILCVLNITNVLGQDKVDKQKKLNFLLQKEVHGSWSEDGNVLYNLIVVADIKEVKKADRVYIRIIDPETNKNLFVRTINKEILQEKLSISDASFKTFSFDKEILKMKFGPFKRGTYDVLIKIKDDKRNMYFDRKKIIF